MACTKKPRQVRDGNKPGPKNVTVKPHRHSTQAPCKGKPKR
jgi:hypothetical protein